MIDAVRHDREANVQRSRVKSDSAILAGKPVLEGTRVSVELILEKLAAGESERQILEAHPRLAEDAVRVALAFTVPIGCELSERSRLSGEAGRPRERGSADRRGVSGHTPLDPPRD